MIYPYPDGLSWPEHSALHDAQLPYPAKGLLAHCLTLPPETAVTIGQISRAQRLPYKRVQRDMRALQERFYAVKRAGREGKGHWGGIYFDLYAVPAPLYHEHLGAPSQRATHSAIGGKWDTPHPFGHNGQMGHPIGSNGQMGEQGLSLESNGTYHEYGHPFGHNGQMFSLSSSLDLKEREKEEDPFGHNGQMGEPCSYHPGFPCEHYRAALQAIQSALATAYPHFRVERGTHVHREVFDTVHRPEFDAAAITLIYRHLVARGEKPEWLYPNKVLSLRSRDDKLAQAQVWAAENAARPPAACEHADWGHQGGRFVCLGCGQEMGEAADEGAIHTFIEQRWGKPNAEEPPDAD